MSDYLPKDIIIDILVRLPLKTLIQTTTVCKQWYSLITSSNFISTHLKQTIGSNTKNTNHLLLVRHYDMFAKVGRYALYRDNDSFDEFSELNCEFNCENEYFRIVGSCNGLICLADDYDLPTDNIVVWNPLIRKSVALPKARFEFTSRGLCVVGFGYDCVGDDYKVVRIVYDSMENYNFRVPPKVEVYTLSTGCWRSLGDVAPRSVVYNNSPAPALVNGAVHWVASPSVEDTSGVGNSIVAFDVSSEDFREIVVPDSVADKYVIKLSVMVLDISLALVQYDKIWQSDYCWIWVMKEYGVGESWSRLFTIDMRGGIRTVVGFRKNHEIFLSARIIGMASYDPKAKEMTYLDIHGTNRSFYAGSYVESLVLLNRGNEVPGVADSSDAFISKGAPLSPEEKDRTDEHADHIESKKVQGLPVQVAFSIPSAAEERSCK